MVIKESYESRKSEYDTYLESHIGGVIKSFEEIVMPYLLDCGKYDSDYVGLISTVINRHDKSKYGKEEYEPYLNYFYPEECVEQDEYAFDLAWLHHQQVNPHHWQYWCLIRDGGEIVPMDMEFEYIIEMLCDWSSFKYKKPDSTANNWYSQNKDKMKLSENTREVVEEILAACPEL